MIRKILTLAASILLFTSIAFSAELSELPKMAKQMFDPSVQILMNIDGQSMGACSGTIISSKKINEEFITKVLTARHCAYTSPDGISEVPMKSVKVLIKDYGKEARLTTTSFYEVSSEYSKDYDLAILTFKNNKEQFPTAKLGDSSMLDYMKFGQTVYSVSYPKGNEKTFTTGVFENNVDMSEGIPKDSGQLSDTNFYQTSVLIDHGSSGSGLFVKDKKGDFRYIGTASMSGGDFINFYTSLEDVLKYLKETNNI